jgi:hypothetical protein
MWRCVKCREKVGDDFDVCWNCGTGRDGTEDPEFRKADDVPPEGKADELPGQGLSQDAPKQRLGCLTAWLVLMILANAFALVSVPLRFGSIKQLIPDAPDWMIWPTFFLPVLNIVFAIALLNWKKWGFFGVLGTSLVAFALNIYLGIGIPYAVAGFAGVAILFALLRIGGEQSGWSQLE